MEVPLHVIDSALLGPEADGIKCVLGQLSGGLSALPESTENPAITVLDATMVLSRKVLAAGILQTISNPRYRKTSSSQLFFASLSNPGENNPVEVFGSKTDKPCFVLIWGQYEEGKLLEIGKSMNLEPITESNESTKEATTNGTTFSLANKESIQKYYGITDKELKIGDLETSVIMRIAARDI